MLKAEVRFRYKDKSFIMKDINYQFLNDGSTRYFDLFAIMTNLWKLCEPDISEFVLDVVYNIKLRKYDMFLDLSPTPNLNKIYPSLSISIGSNNYIWFINENKIEEFIKKFYDHNGKYFRFITKINTEGLCSCDKYLIDKPILDSYAIEFFIDEYYRDTIRYYYIDIKNGKTFRDEYFNCDIDKYIM